eukprot:scaffold42954_cov74-Phaeocystis_antarctica.AAC.10
MASCPRHTCSSCYLRCSWCIASDAPGMLGASRMEAFARGYTRARYRPDAPRSRQEGAGSMQAAVPALMADQAHHDGARAQSVEALLRHESALCMFEIRVQKDRLTCSRRGWQGPAAIRPG